MLTNTTQNTSDLIKSNDYVLQQRRSFDDTRALLCLSRSGFYKLLKSDPSFPRPIKDGISRRARVYFLESEIAIWQQAKLSSRSVSGGQTTDLVS